MLVEGNALPERMRTVLVVDDEFLISMMLEGMLADLGVRKVLVASDVASAHRLMGEAAVDCVLLDVRLRGVESYEFADFLVERAIPLVFSTGIGLHDIPERFLGLPALGKPFSVEQLKSALLQALK